MRTVSSVRSTISVERCRPSSVRSIISQRPVVRSFVTRPRRETGIRHCRRWLVIGYLGIQAIRGRPLIRLHETVLWVAFIQRSATIAMASTGNGTRLRSSINSKGDMAYLLFRSLSMPVWFCNARARGIPTKKVGLKPLISEVSPPEEVRAGYREYSERSKDRKSGRKYRHIAQNFPPSLEGSVNANHGFYL